MALPIEYTPPVIEVLPTNQALITVGSTQPSQNPSPLSSRGSSPLAGSSSGSNSSIHLSPNITPTGATDALTKLNFSQAILGAVPPLPSLNSRFEISMSSLPLPAHSPHIDSPRRSLGSMRGSKIASLQVPKQSSPPSVTEEQRIAIPHLNLVNLDPESDSDQKMSSRTTTHRSNSLSILQVISPPPKSKARAPTKFKFTSGGASQDNGSTHQHQASVTQEPRPPSPDRERALDPRSPTNSVSKVISVLTTEAQPSGPVRAFSMTSIPENTVVPTSTHAALDSVRNIRLGQEEERNPYSTSGWVAAQNVRVVVNKGRCSTLSKRAKIAIVAGLVLSAATIGYVIFRFALKSDER